MSPQDTISANKDQWIVLSIIAFAGLCLTFVLCLSDCSFFQRFVGGLNPVMALIISIVAGFGVLFILLEKGWFEIYKRGVAKYKPKYVWLTVILACISILIDWIVVFPEDMNLAFPQSLLFYPAIAFVVEIFFHVLPMGVVFVYYEYFFQTC